MRIVEGYQRIIQVSQKIVQSDQEANIRLTIDVPIPPSLDFQPFCHPYTTKPAPSGLLPIANLNPHPKTIPLPRLNSTQNPYLCPPFTVNHQPSTLFGK
jgi:hypothetical protein